MQKILIIGSNSIHCKRYVAGIISHKCNVIGLISNSYWTEFPNLMQVTVNFSLFNLIASYQIKQFLIQFKPDIIHIHQANSYAWHSLWAIKWAKIKAKVILTTWGSDVLVLPLRNKLFSLMVKFNLKNVQLITADSLFMVATIHKLLATSLIPPIQLLNFGMEQLPQRIDLTCKRKLILSTRLHKPLYQIKTIIYAFNELIPLISHEYNLVIAASGEETPQLISLVESLGIGKRVVFSGMLPYLQLQQCYQDSSVFVSIPQSDGTASSLLEAMAYGCIPVLANLPANLEWVIDKVNGFIVPSLNQLATSILAAITLSQQLADYQQLYDFNYRLISTKADFKQNIISFINLYND